MTLMETANKLANTHNLINTFTIKQDHKNRIVNNPIPELKQALKKFNTPLTKKYEDVLLANNIENIAQAYLPKKSIATNASIHQYSKTIIKYDFSHFYDDVRFSYFKEYLRELIPEMTKENEHLIKRLLINPKTKGVTQGLPVSGALAGLSLIPFWIKLRKLLPKTIQFTQYSDDLIFSYTTPKQPSQFNMGYLTKQIKRALIESNRAFTINEKKTSIQKDQFRSVTGVHINHENKKTPTLKDYRFLRMFSYSLRRGTPLDECLNKWGFASKASFVGKVSYMRSIDETGKIDKLLHKYAKEYMDNNLFTTWLVMDNPFI